MAQKLARVYEESKIGASQDLAFNTTTSVRADLSSGKKFPILFVIRADEDVYIRQGDSAIDATANDFLLFKDYLWGVVAESDKDRYLAALGVTNPGSIRITDSTYV